MYKKALCTCKVVVLRNKPIAFLTSYLPSPSSFLKLPSMPVLRTDGRLGGRSAGRTVGWAGGRAYGHVITKFPRMGRLLHFLIHGASLLLWLVFLNKN